MQPEKKMKRLENRELFQDFNRTIASVLFEENTYPWEVLPKIHDFIMEVGMLLSKDEYEEVKEHVWVAKSAMVAPTAYINGPAIIGPDAEIRHCAFIRGNAIVGEGAVVGNSTELKNVILFDKVQVHLDDTKIETHMKKIGAILGDYVEVGCGSILNPGTIVGRHSNIYPLSSVRGYVAGHSIYKNKNEVVQKEEY